MSDQLATHEANNTLKSDAITLPDSSELATIDTRTIDELEAEIKSIEEGKLKLLKDVLKRKYESQRADDLLQIKTWIKVHNFIPSELYDVQKTKKEPSKVPKKAGNSIIGNACVVGAIYEDPKKENESWTGRKAGAKPGWLDALIPASMDLEEAKVEIAKYVKPSPISND